jgi:hypothetical protein
MELDRRSSQRPIATPRITWSAVFAGWAVGLTLQMVLTVAGLGLGAWTIDLHAADPGQDIPIGAGIWTGLSMLLSAFSGGYTTASCARSTDRGDGLYHGVVVWAVSWLVFAWLTTTAMATMIGGAFSIFGTTVQRVGQTLSQATSMTASRSVGVVTRSIHDLQTEIQSATRATGQPEVPSEEDEHRGRGALTRTGGEPLRHMTDRDLADWRDALSALDRGAAPEFIINRLARSDAQAKDVLRSTIGVMAPLPDTMRGTKQRSTALEAAEALDRLGITSLWLSGLALISLVMSALGGMMGGTSGA